MKKLFIISLLLLMLASVVPVIAVTTEVDIHPYGQFWKHRASAIEYNGSPLSSYLNGIIPFIGTNYYTTGEVDIKLASKASILYVNTTDEAILLALNTFINTTAPSIYATIANLSNYLPLSVITTSGDLILGTGSGAVTRLGIGANGTTLTSDGTTASWAAPTPGYVLVSTTSVAGLRTVEIALSATKTKYKLVGQVTRSSYSAPVCVYFNKDYTTGNYTYNLLESSSTPNSSQSTFYQIRLLSNSGPTTAFINVEMFVKPTEKKYVMGLVYGTDAQNNIIGGSWSNTTDAATTTEVVVVGSTFSSGSLELWGM